MTAGGYPLIGRQGTTESVTLRGDRATALHQIFACAEIVVPIPSYAKISGPDADAKSGADPDDHCRHRQAYGKGDGNHGHDCKKQIFFGLHLVEFRHGYSTNRKVRKPSPENDAVTAFWLTLCPEAPGQGVPQDG
jgi:hypothetical protein